MDLLLLVDDDKSRYVYIKTLTDLWFTKEKIKTKSTFVEGVCNNVLTEHKEDCLGIDVNSV